MSVSLKEACFCLCDVCIFTAFRLCKETVLESYVRSKLYLQNDEYL